jgi:hypothetical protein
VRSAASVANRSGLDQRLFTGPVTYLPLQFHRAVPSSLIFPLDGFKLGGKAVDVGEDPQGGSIMHPGGWIGMLDSTADALMAHIPGMVEWRPTEEERRGRNNAGQPFAYQQKYYLVPCDTTQSLSIMAGGQEFAIPPEKWIAPYHNDSSGCFAVALILPLPASVSHKSIVLLGQPFLSSVYTALRFNETWAEIGFAQLSDTALAATAGSWSADGLPAEGPPTENGSNMPPKEAGTAEGSPSSSRTINGSRGGASAPAATSGCSPRLASRRRRSNVGADFVNRMHPSEGLVTILSEHAGWIWERVGVCMSEAVRQARQTNLDWSVVPGVRHVRDGCTVPVFACQPPLGLSPSELDTAEGHKEHQ